MITGVGFSLLEAWGVKQTWMLQLHIGHFGSLNLSSVYPTVLGVMTLVIIVSGVQLYWPVRKRWQEKAFGGRERGG